ncbi:MAG: type II toxin-antitoxin system Phd/YefM family antitoxin [Actinomycetota bacterium]
MRCTQVAQVGVREFRSNLRRWIDAVQRGEDVVVTERGRPVARLMRASASSKLDALIAAGVVTPAKDAKRPSSSFSKVKAGRGRISDLVIEQRR